MLRRLAPPRTAHRALDHSGRELLEQETLLELVGKERERADRTQDELSLATIRLGSPRRGCDPGLYHALDMILKRIRRLDEVGWLRPGTLGILLPATSLSGARKLVGDLRRNDTTGHLRHGKWVLYSYPEDWVEEDDDGEDRGDGPPGNGRVRGARVPPRVRVHAGEALVDALSGGEGAAGNGAAGNGAAGNGAAGNGAAGNGAVRTGVVGTSAVPGGAAAPAENEVASAEEVRPLADLFVAPLPGWKRAIDIVGSAVGLTLLSPVMLAAILGIKLTSPGPLLYASWRSGVRGRPFRFYKFRTMYTDAEARKAELLEHNEASGPVFKMSNDPRVTWIGRILRKTSVDELPQLWNVLKGDMSLVGPRPPIPEETTFYAPWQRRRLEGKGGLTCIWQVSGRSDVQFEDWVRMDIDYLEGRSLWTDLRLLLQTIPAVFSCRGAK